jgi:predicted O-methyltransferase YrrM
MRSDHRRIIWICLAFTVSTGLAVWFAPKLGLVLGLTALLVVVLGVLLDEMHRLNRRMRKSFRQTEATVALYVTVKPRLPLPQMRGWAMSPDMAGIVFATVMKRRPRTVVELGSGTSTLVAGYALERLGGEGRVVSLDHDQRFAQVSRGNVERHGLDGRIEVVHAPLRSVELQGKQWDWYETSALDPIESIDVLVVDGPTQAGNPRSMVRFPALPALLPKLSPDAVVLVDDAGRADERAMVAKWQELYPEFAVEFVPTEAGTAILERRSPRPGGVLEG